MPYRAKRQNEKAPRELEVERGAPPWAEEPADIEAFVRRFERPVYRYVLRLIGESEAEDITQEIFLKAIAALPRFRGEASLETWVFRIATNACRDHLRRKRWQRLLFIRKPEDDANPATHAPAKGDPIEESELRSLIRSALRELPPSQREILVLRDVEGFSYEEIASIVGCPAGTVKSRLFYARVRLAEKLRAMGFTAGSARGVDSVRAGESEGGRE